MTRLITIPVWSVFGDDHDHDMMSQWFVGTFTSEKDAEDAMKVDEAAYHRSNPGSKKRGLPNHEVHASTIIVDLDQLEKQYAEQI